jgi:predicted nucleic acid-binding protein
MRVVFDTTFLALHYFSTEAEVLSKTRNVLRACRKLGNEGIVPTIVLADFYALTHKRAGRDVAERRFKEVVESGLHVVELSVEISRQADIIRRKYEEKIPWGDCIITATGLLSKADFVVTEDSHFQQIKEIRTRKLVDLVA